MARAPRGLRFGSMKPLATRPTAATIIQSAVTIAALAAMAWLLVTERERLMALPSLGLLPLALAFATTLANVAVGGVQLKVMLDRFEGGVSYFHSLLVVLGGYTLNYLPMKAGTVLMGATLKTRWNVRLAHYAALSAAGQLVSLWSSVTLAGGCLLLVGGSLPVGLMLLVSPSLGLAVLTVWSRYAVNTNTEHANRYVEALRTALKGLSELFLHRGVMAIVFSVNLSAILMMAVRVFVLLGALSHPVGILDAIVISSFSTAAYIFGVLPGGIGIKEGGIVAGAALVGVDPTTALALAVLDRAVDLLLVLVLGVPSALWMGRGPRPTPGESTQGRPA